MMLNKLSHQKMSSQKVIWKKPNLFFVLSSVLKKQLTITDFNTLTTTVVDEAPTYYCGGFLARYGGYAHQVKEPPQ